MIVAHNKREVNEVRHVINKIMVGHTTAVQFIQPFNDKIRVLHEFFEKTIRTHL